MWYPAKIVDTGILFLYRIHLDKVKRCATTSDMRVEVLLLDQLSQVLGQFERGARRTAASLVVL